MTAAHLPLSLDIPIFSQRSPPPRQQASSECSPQEEAAGNISSLFTYFSMPALALASFLLSLSIKVRLDYQKDKDTGWCC